MTCDRPLQPLIHQVPLAAVKRAGILNLMVLCILGLFGRNAFYIPVQYGIRRHFGNAQTVIYRDHGAGATLLLSWCMSSDGYDVLGELHRSAKTVHGVCCFPAVSTPLHWTSLHFIIHFRWYSLQYGYGLCVPVLLQSVSRIPWPESGPGEQDDIDWRSLSTPWAPISSSCVEWACSGAAWPQVVDIFGQPWTCTRPTNTGYPCLIGNIGMISLRLSIENSMDRCFSAIPLHWPLFFWVLMVLVETIPLHWSATILNFAISNGLASMDDIFPGCHGLIQDFLLLCRFRDCMDSLSFVIFHLLLTIPLHWSTAIAPFDICHRVTFLSGTFTGHHGLTVEHLGMLLYVSSASHCHFDLLLQCFVSHAMCLMEIAIPLHWHLPSAWERPLSKNIPWHWPGAEKGRWLCCVYPDMCWPLGAFRLRWLAVPQVLSCFLDGPTVLRRRWVLSVSFKDVLAEAHITACSHLAMRSLNRANLSSEGTILHGVSLPKSNEIFATISWPTERPDFWFCLPRENDCPFCSDRDWNPYTASRVGEALHPGPLVTSCVFRMSQVNPTFVYQKSDLLATQGEVVLCAETSATQGVQVQERKVMRSFGYNTVWSPPQPAQRPTIQATEDLRGKASGLMVMSKFPIRSAQHQEPLAMWRAGRYQRSFLTVGSLTIQLVQIYGYPSCHADSRTMTNELCRHACSEAMQLDMPTIYAGDFNHPPAALPAFQVLLAKGYVTSQQLYGRLHHREQPPTCRDATFNDGFVFCPTTVHWIQNVTVEEQYLFADHTPVQLEIHMPVATPTRTIWRLPHSWTQFVPQPQEMAKQYGNYRSDPPTSLENWAQLCEQAVHGAIRTAHSQDPLRHPFASLPRRARGRCQPRKCVKVPLYQPIRPAGAHQYAPGVDGSTAHFRRAVRQLRGVQSLLRRLQKLEADPTLTPDWTQLIKEWEVISDTLFEGQPYTAWLAKWPELPDQQDFFPTLSYLDQACQLTKHQVQHLESQEKRRLQAAHRYERLYDKKWSSNAGAFRKIRPAAPPCLTMLKATSTFDILDIKGVGTGLLTCKIPQFGAPHPLADYRLGDLQLQFCAQHNDEIDFLQTDADKPLPPQRRLVVQIPTTDTQEVADGLNHYWARFWTRDDDTTDWTEFSDLLRRTPMVPALDTDLTLEEWKQAIRHLKIGTARGVCGWYAQELRDLPDLAVEDLFHLFRDHMASMPSHLMHARTIPLGKTAQPDHAHLTRPITVLSLLYRLWGRATTVKILQHWTKHFPTAVVGFLPARSMTNAMVGFQWKLEQAHLGMDLSYGGLTLDLVKAFNLIGREPAAEAMLHYGLPSDWVQFWFSSITAMDRVWEINGSLSQPFQPTTGCPEGDTWSVVAMLALSNVWVHMLQDTPKPVAPLSYADNLGWSAQDPDAHQDALTLTLAWSQALRLQVDWKKTWVWATDSTHADAWRHLRQQFTELQDVLKVTNARELGYMIAYSKCQNKKTFFARHSEALEQCRRISRLPHPLSVKGNLLRAPLSRLLYGTELHMVSLEHLRQLRTAMARALLGGKAQPNPYLALALLHKDILDPHFQLLYHAFRALRRFLWSLTAGARDQFFRQVVRHSGRPWQIFGPAGTLRYHLDFLGWTMTAHGQTLTDAFGKLDFLTCAPAHLHQELVFAWERHVQLLLQARKAWKGVPQPDFVTTASLFIKLPTDRQRILAGELTGSFQLQHRKTKWVEGLDEHCPLCGGEDTVEHRRLHCPALQQARLAHSEIVDHLLEIDQVLTTLPVIYRHPEYVFDHWWSHQIPEAALMPSARQILAQDHERGLRPLVFTDGSAAPPAYSEARQAAGAAVVLSRSHIVTPEKREQMLHSYFATSVLPPEFVTMCLLPTPGSQTIPRSELAIVVQVIQHCPCVEIVTDSQYVIDLHWRAKAQSNIAALQALPNFDLLYRLHTLQGQPGYDVVLTKVASHQLIPGLPTRERVFQLGNEAADQAAKTARTQLVEACRQVPASHFLEERHRVAAQFALCYDVGCLRKNLLQMTDDTTEPTPPAADFLVTEVDDPHVFPPNLHQTPLLRYSLWGAGFTEGILFWASQVRWPRDSFCTAKADTASVGVTWMELLLDCQLTLQLQWPHSTVSSKHPPLLRHPGLHGVNQLDVPFTWNLSNFRRALRHLEDLLGLQLLPKARGTVNSLYRLGARGHKKGIPWRPQLCCPQEVEHSLREYFRLHPHCTQFREQPTMVPIPAKFVVCWKADERSYEPDIGKHRLARFTSWKQKGRPSSLRFDPPM